MFMIEDEDRAKEKWSKSPTDYYLAQLALYVYNLNYTVASLFSKIEGKQPTVDDFMMTFRLEVSAPAPPVETKVSTISEDDESLPLEQRAWWKAAVENERAWAGFIGVDPSEFDKYPPQTG